MTYKGLVFEVIGTPSPQGSKRAFTHSKTGKTVLVDASSRTLHSWRDSVSAAALADSQEKDLRFPRPTCVKVKIEFRLPRPKNQTKMQQAIPYVATKPDVDKLARGVLDALTTAQVFDDDSQVAVLECWKVYASAGIPLGALVAVSEAR